MHIRHSKSACVITNNLCYISSTLKICPNLKPTAQLVYIVIDADCDYERLFLQIYNISQTFYNISCSNYFDYGIT